MALIEFRHVDLRISVRRNEGSGLLLIVGEASPNREQYVLPDFSIDGLGFDLPSQLSGALEQILSGKAFQEWGEARR